jgi:ketosteroid isomerase-like protein
MSVNEIAQEYVAYVKAGRFLELLERFYAAEAVSVEAAAMPGQERAAAGLEALKAKSQGFDAEHEVTRSEVLGVWPHGEEKFAVHMVFEMIHTPTKHRRVMDEIAVLTVQDGKIVKEEFFYAS